jgi:hypothetical protein
LAQLPPPAMKDCVHTHRYASVSLLGTVEKHYL